MEWTIHGERPSYESAWVSLALVDVEVPGGARFEHHVVRLPTQAAGVVVHDDDRGVLLLWRHRFITDTWGYEVPAGAVEQGEDLVSAASREVLEETGWAVDGLRPLTRFHPTNGLSDQVFNIFEATGATYVGEPSDPSESERIDWVPVDEVRQLLRDNQVTDGLSLTALAYWFLNAE